MTLFTPEAFNQIYGPDSRCIRGVYYDMMLPLVSLVTTRHKHIHTHKRKLWDQGFSIKGKLEKPNAIDFHVNGH